MPDIRFTDKEHDECPDCPHSILQHSIKADVYGEGCDSCRCSNRRLP
jgi:hypothetical protein